MATPYATYVQTVAGLKHSRYIVKGRNKLGNDFDGSTWDCSSPGYGEGLNLELMAVALQTANSSYYTDSRLRSLTPNDIVFAYRYAVETNPQHKP